VALVQNPLRRSWQRWSDSWLRNRLPRSRSARLNQRRIFILPSRNGLYFLLLAAALFIGGINYGNGLILLVSLLLVSLFLVAIMHTYANLAGLVVEAGRTQPAFCGQEAAFSVIVKGQGGHQQALNIGWRATEQRGSASQQFDLLDQHSSQLTLLLPVTRRGRCYPPRIRIDTRYPLGLLCAWSWVELDCHCLVYPQPLEAPYPLRTALLGDRGEQLAAEGNDDFDGLGRYQPGDSPRRIAWKSYAREGRLYSKRFIGYQSHEQWLEWDAYSGLATEVRLSRLCFWVLQLDRQQRRFGLKLPGIELKPDSGAAHRQRCLAILALYGLDESSLGAVTGQRSAR
jgi:uncharacterized protein (DUF58 family)